LVLGLTSGLPGKPGLAGMGRKLRSARVLARGG
jgi:hypothetical protein